jgi:hypothetical protein
MAERLIPEASVFTLKLHRSTNVDAARPARHARARADGIHGLP